MTDISVSRKKDANICYLNFLVHRTSLRIEIEIEKKPTSSDTEIYFNSNRPKQHKTADFKFLLTRMNKLFLPIRKTRILQ